MLDFFKKLWYNIYKDVKNNVNDIHIIEVDGNYFAKPEGLDEELLEELSEMIDNGCSMVEVFEYIEDNTDEDPTEYITKLM